MKHALVLVASVLLLAGCSGGTKAPSARCQPVSDARAALILGGEDGIYPVKAGAVKSTEHKDAYYIAIRFAGPGIEDGKTVGVWASAGGIESGNVVSVDAVAEGFSGILKDANFSTTDDGADEARTCV